MESVRQQMIDTGRWIMEKNLTWGTSGNISAREGGRVYLTASGTVLGDLKEEDIVVLDLSGKVLSGEKKPSKEAQMHLAVYRVCEDVQGIIHASPFYSTFAACCDMELKTDLFIESMYYDASVRRIPYFHAGTAKLADAVEKVCAETHVILMEHHGVLVYDRTLAECRSSLEVTENVCKMNLMAGMAGLPLRELPAETVSEFLSGGYYKKR